MVILPYNLQNGALDSRVHTIKGMFLERKMGRNSDLQKQPGH